MFVIMNFTLRVFYLYIGIIKVAISVTTPTPIEVES